MKATNAILVAVVVWVGHVQQVLAEIPAISFVVTANADTPFAKVVPIVSVLRKQRETEIDFAIGDENDVSVTIRLRSDMQLVTREEMLRIARNQIATGRKSALEMFIDSDSLDQTVEELKKAGASRVQIEKVPIFPAMPFSVAKFEELRKQKKTVIVVCRADWNIQSIKMNYDVFDNADVIRHVQQAKVPVLIADITKRPDEATQEFLKSHQSYEVVSVLVFQPGKDKPSIHKGEMSAEEFIRLVERESQGDD